MRRHHGVRSTRIRFADQLIARQTFVLDMATRCPQMIYGWVCLSCRDDAVRARLDRFRAAGRYGGAS